MVFHWSQSDKKFPNVSRTLLSILADPIKAAVQICLMNRLFANGQVDPGSIQS